MSRFGILRRKKLALEMKIRLATQDDADRILVVHLSAFSEGEGDIISRLAVDLLSEDTVPPVISLVSEDDGLITGHVAFSPVMACETKEHIGYILAPLAVSPDYWRRGIASRLIGNGIERISALGPGVLLVYGDPDFYGRFGFSAGCAEHYTPPCRLQYAHGWLGMLFDCHDTRQSDVRISCVSSLCNPDLW